MGWCIRRRRKKRDFNLEKLISYSSHESLIYTKLKTVLPFAYIKKGHPSDVVVSSMGLFDLWVYFVFVA